MSSSPGCPSPAPTGSFAPSPGPLAFHGGPIVADYYHTPVLHAPPNTNRLFVDYWGWQSDPSGVRPYLHNFLSGLGGSSWLNTITQYSCNSCTDAPQILNNTGMLAGEYSNPSSAPTYVYTTSSWSSYKLLVGQEATKDESYFGGFTDPAAIYVIALPPNHWDFSSGTCAVHGSYTDSSGNSVYWVLLPYLPEAGAACGGGLASVSISAGHEIAETMTDPEPLSVNSAWFGNAGEVADECPWSDYTSNVTFSTGTFPVQALWSNAAGSSNPNAACVFNYP